MDLINLNTAQPDELTSLPGVGPALANRIINARPFETMDDVFKVSGIGPALLERWESLVTLVDPMPAEVVLIPGDGFKPDDEAGEAQPELATHPEAEPDEALLEIEVESKTEDESLEVDDFSETDEDITPEDETSSDPNDEIIPREKALVAMKQEESKPKKEKAGPKPVTRMQVFLIAAACSFAAFIFAVLLSIGIIGGINNGLSFASPQQVQKLSNQANTINEEIGIIVDDVDSLRSRLDNFDSLNGRVGDLEAEAEVLTSELAATTEAVTAMNDQVTEMNTQLEALMSYTEKFQAFLDGLENLLQTISVPATPVEETP